VLDELSAPLDELGSTDELDGSTELLLGATLDDEPSAEDFSM
jgi:hypothetical protein